MDIEDAAVLADALIRAPDIETALTAFVERRGQHVDWVREQSAAVGQMIGLPPATRDAARSTRVASKRSATASHHSRSTLEVKSPLGPGAEALGQIHWSRGSRRARQ